MNHLKSFKLILLAVFVLYLSVAFFISFSILNPIVSEFKVHSGVQIIEFGSIFLAFSIMIATISFLNGGSNKKKTLPILLFLIYSLFILFIHFHLADNMTRVQDFIWIWIIVLLYLFFCIFIVRISIKYNIRE
ncbi:hypothetical protein MsAm2_06690 [Methanolapillus ohkumae]|uniref:Uncharacterized protein n=1 Tax=Methanolapillus ohkumae TaxID=3028298 RepID=A0AA97A603_9EURY|nr:hypothetical protein MsAm2_06690 [Methanosarcinaceae archaeon Am2]